MTDRETLRLIHRALWVDHGDGNLDALTGELPVWADEWAERIVAAANGQPAQSGRVIRTATKWGVRLPNGDVRSAESADDAREQRDSLRGAIEDEFGVRPADYNPEIVQCTEITTASDWMPAPLAGIRFTDRAASTIERPSDDQ